jgi:ribose transport system substrate-binding protein
MKHSKFFALLTVLMVASMLVTPAFAAAPAPAQPQAQSAPAAAVNPYVPTKLMEIVDLLKKATEGKKAPAGSKIAFMINIFAPFWDAARIGCFRASQEFGVPVDFQGPTGTTGDRILQQNNMIDTFVANKYSAIIFSADDPVAPKDYIKKAVDAGLPVIMMDSDAPGTARQLYIGMDDFDAGKLAAAAALEVVKEGKMVAQFGDETSNNGQTRLAGFKEAIKGTKLEVVETLYDGGSPEKALSLSQMALQKYPDLAGFFGIWSYIGPVQGQAVKQAGMTGKVKVIAWDTEPETQRLMSQGVVQVMMAQRAYFYGYLSSWVAYTWTLLGKDATLKLLDPYLTDKGTEKKVLLNTQVDVVKAETFDLYKEYLKEIGIPSQ